MAKRPLDGVRVLDLTRVLTGPHATRMLCDLGADVIKVEPPDGDITRTVNPRVNSMATYFVQQNVGKRYISLDTTKPEAVDVLLRLADHCDVLIENFRPGVMDRMGLGYDTVAARNPGIVYASISGYGSTGPWASRRAYAPVVGAETGVTKAQGDARGGHYANDPLSHADVYTALEARRRSWLRCSSATRTGSGDRIDVSMAETMLYVNEHAHDQLWDGEVPPEWIRSFDPPGYPVLTAANGERVVISGAPGGARHVRPLHEGDRPTDLIDDPRFVDVPSRLDHLADLVEVLHEWAVTMPDAGSDRGGDGRYGLAVGTLRSVRDVCDTDWARAARGRRGGRRSWRRHDAHPEHAVALRRRRRRASRRSRDTAARTTAPCSANCSASTTPSSIAWRPTACSPAGAAPSDALRFPVAPMKAAIGTLPPDDENWAYEIKWDGYRTLAFVDGGQTRLQSSNVLDVTAKYPETGRVRRVGQRGVGDHRRRAGGARRRADGRASS